MPVKHWTFGGLLLTYWCNARCASCYVCSGPDAAGDMSVETGLAIWEGLQSASPHGCRIHIGGGEPFGRWAALIELARRAHAGGLGPLQTVETNAYWASDANIVRRRLSALDAAGMERLTISADPYHQQFVPIDRVRLAARVGEEVLGAERVRIRWRDWAQDGFDTADLSEPERRQVFAEYARRGRDRLGGRAAVQLAGNLQLRAAADFADYSCAGPLLRSQHVHVDGEGVLCPGTCAGIVLARATDSESVGRIWRALAARFADSNDSHPRGADVLGLLATGGPTALARTAAELGYRTRAEGYAAKCHLCWDVRRWLFERGTFKGQLGPAAAYNP